MAIYKFSLPRPNRWAELALGLPSTFAGLFLGVRFYHFAWFMPFAGIFIADALFTIAYRYAFYKVAYDGSEDLKYPGWKFYAAAFALQMVFCALVGWQYFTGAMQQ
jgi:hypothetical protein